MIPIWFESEDSDRAYLADCPIMVRWRIAYLAPLEELVIGDGQCRTAVPMIPPHTIPNVRVSPNASM
jgi:hypothetical protein